MRFLNMSDSPNTIVGLFLLVLLGIMAGPEIFPELVASFNLDEGVPCSRLRDGTDRANHQSLIAREASLSPDPLIDLEVRTGSVPLDGVGNYEITIVVTNQTIAPVPILITPDTLILDPNIPQNGFGIVFNSTASIPVVGESTQSYPEERIRILGPRQRCIHRVSIPITQIPNVSTLIAANATTKAFYRNTVRGSLQVLDVNQPFSDQGLWIGVVESPIINVSSSSQ